MRGVTASKVRSKTCRPARSSSSTVGREQRSSSVQASASKRLAQLIERERLVARAEPRVVQSIERFGDRSGVIEHRAPARLGGMRREHRHHQHAVEQRAHVVGGDAALAQ